MRQSINYNHLLPTRYALELEGLKGSVAPETFKEPSNREDAKKTIKKAFEERYMAGKNRYRSFETSAQVVSADQAKQHRWFFTPLRF